MSFHHKSHQSSGYTLIEVLITSAMLLVVVGVVISFWWYIQDSFRLTFGQSVSIDVSYGALTRMVGELRQVQESENGAYALDNTQDQEVSFYSDVDDDGETEKVRYWLDNEDLKRGVTEPGGQPAIYDPGNEIETVVVSGIISGSDPIFSYYNGDWPQDTINNPLTAGNRLLDTRMIEVRLKIRNDRGIATDSAIVSHAVVLRGIKTNL